jgi:hemerythrin-like domain-containing protein
MSRISTRRAMLVAATGATLYTAWSGAEAQDDSQRNEDRGPGEIKGVGSVEDLMREHGVLRRILLIYQQSAIKLRDNETVDLATLNRAARLFRTFGEDWHQKTLEEGFIYPSLRKVRGPAAHYPDVLAAQHHRGRQITDYILETTSKKKLGGHRGVVLARTFDGFVLMYQNHSAREDTFVFPAWKQALAESDLDELGDRFEDMGRTQWGKEGFDTTVDEVASIETALGYGDLSQFTAPDPPPDA